MGSTPVGTAPSALGDRHGGLARTYWAAFGAFAVLLFMWALASPPMAGPDEDAHVVKAAAVVRGELRGRSAPGNPGSGLVTVPKLAAYGMGVPTCYAFNPTVSAACIAPPPADLKTPVDAPTWVIRNNPLYYAIVGLPTLTPTGVWVFYAMRALSALLCAAVLAWGVRSLAEVTRPGFGALGMLAAVTPMVLFLGSVVNSSALEITSALSLWVSLLVLLRAPDPGRVRVRMAGIAVLSVLLANSRGLSPLFLAVIGLAAILVSPWTNTLSVLRDRRSWPWFGVIAAGVVTSLAWIGLAGTLNGGSTASTGISFKRALVTAIVLTPDYLASMLGHFGWLDTSLPGWTLGLLALGVCVVVVLALLHARRRDVLAVVAVGAVAIILPILVQAWQSRNVGMIWQGRYSLPLMVGLPIVAGFVVRGSTLAKALGPRRVFVATACILGVGQVVSIAINLHRYMRGSNVRWFGDLPGEWQPPVPAQLIVLVFAVAYVGLAVLLDRPSHADVGAVGPVPVTAAALVEDCVESTSR